MISYRYDLLSPLWPLGWYWARVHAHVLATVGLSMAQLTAEERGRLDGASSRILPTHRARSGPGRTAQAEASSRKSRPAGETRTLGEVGGGGSQPKAQSGKAVFIREVSVPIRNPEQEGRPASLLRVAGAPATGSRAAFPLLPVGQCQDLQPKGPQDSSLGQELTGKENDRWGPC